MRRRMGPWRSILLCCVLQLGVMAGVPMRPDEIQKLMQSLAKPQVTATLPEEAEKSGDGDGRRLARRLLDQL
jgi:hypothetical protein